MTQLSGNAFGRVYRSGSFARITAIIIACAFLLATVIGLVGNVQRSTSDYEIIVAIVVACVVLIARSAVIGIWITPRGIVARSWFRTWRFAAPAVHRCDTAPYWQSVVGTADSAFLSVVTFTLVGGKVVDIRASVAPRGTTKRQVEQIRAYLSQASSDAR